MSEHRFIAIPTRTAEIVRRTMESPGYGHPAHREIATGHGPRRHCLAEFVVGAEERILFTFDPFDGLESLPLPGPVFVHAHDCVRHAEESGFPDQLREHALTLNGDAAGRRLPAQEYVVDGNMQSALDRIFGNGEITDAHVRDTKAGAEDR